MEGGKEMKNTFKILAGAAMLAAFASCELNDFPAFDDADSFVALDKSSVLVDETAGTVTIPVTIASIDPVKTAVTYEVVDGTAKAGENYRMQDESCVLSFDGTARTMEIVIDIVDLSGTYTGDLSFTINLLSGGKTLNLGANSSCTVKISDLDHPLADILGTYGSTGFNYFDGVEEAWTTTLYKDDNDVKVVWIDGIISALAGTYPSADYRVYGNVSEDKETISIPLGQALKSTVNGNAVSLWGFNGSSVNNSGTLEFTLENGVWVLKDIGLGIGYETEDGRVSLYGLYNPNTITWTKK